MPATPAAVRTAFDFVWREGRDPSDPAEIAALRERLPEADGRGLDEAKAGLREATDARLVLIEPFLLPVRQEQWDWRPDLDARIQVVRRLAAESGAVLLPAGGLLARAARLLGGPGKVADDGVHPTGEGTQGAGGRLDGASHRGVRTAAGRGGPWPGAGPGQGPVRWRPAGCRRR